MSEIYNKFAPQKVVRRTQILDYFEADHHKTNAGLRWLTESGKAQRIKYGLYYFKQPDEWHNGEVIVSPWLVAVNAVKDSVIAYHSALKLLGYAYSETSEIQITVNFDYNRVPKSFKYQGVRYKYFRSDLTFGLTGQSISEQKIKTFNKERLVLEGLMYPDKFYGMPEYLKSVDNIKWLDLDDLLKMIYKYPVPTISMRLGWLLQRYRKKWYVDENHLNQLKAHRPENRVFMVSRLRKSNILDKTWNLMIPRNLLHLDEQDV